MNKTYLPAIAAFLIALSFAAMASDESSLISGKALTLAKTMPTSEFINIYSGGNYVMSTAGKVSVIFDIDNKDPERPANVTATCIVNYDQAERFILQNGPSEPDTITAPLKRKDGSIVMWPGQNTGYLVFNKGNATIDHIDCKIDSFEMIEDDFVIKFFKGIFHPND